MRDETSGIYSLWSYLSSINFILHPSSLLPDRLRRQRSEQYFTSSQQSAHFLRQVKGRWQTGQTLVGKSDLERARGIPK
jgi:hypothetical protein